MTAAVLAGGRSLRMGVDKTLLAVDGEALVARVVDVMRATCVHTIVVTNRPEALDAAALPADVRVVPDDVAYQGPLGGLATALAVAEDEWVLCVAADMPWIEPRLLRALWAARDGAKVVVPITDEGPEPLLALYHRDCLPAAQRALASGRRRIVAIFRDLPVARVPADDLRSTDPELRSLFNVNSLRDLDDARDADLIPPGQATIATGALEPDAPASATSSAVTSAPVVEREPGRHAERVEAAVGGLILARRPRGLPSEQPVTVHMNDVEIATTQASPQHLEELGVGFLHSEGLLTQRDAMHRVEADYKRGLVWVRTDEAVPDDITYKKRYLTSGCGKGVTFSSVGHAQGLTKIESDLTIEGARLLELIAQMARGAEAYRDTGGMHACGLVRDGELMFVREDVGRHNALDKLLGRAWIDRVPTEDAILLSTGRVSYEMAIKAAKSRVPIVVSRSATTDLAAQIANELGITLVAYCRGGSLVLVSHPERITGVTLPPDEETTR